MGHPARNHTKEVILLQATSAPDRPGLPMPPNDDILTDRPLEDDDEPPSSILRPPLHYAESGLRYDGRISHNKTPINTNFSNSSLSPDDPKVAALVITIFTVILN